jgi:hypothetical protein
MLLKPDPQKVDSLMFVNREADSNELLIISNYQPIAEMATLTITLEYLSFDVSGCSEISNERFETSRFRQTFAVQTNNL